MEEPNLNLLNLPGRYIKPNTTQPDYVGVIVSQKYDVYLKNAIAMIYDGGSMIKIKGNIVKELELEAGQTYRITNGMGLLDTYGVYMSDGVFINAV